MTINQHSKNRKKSWLYGGMFLGGLLLLINQHSKNRKKGRLFGGLFLAVLLLLTAQPVRAGLTDLLADKLGNKLFGDLKDTLASVFPQITGTDEWLSLLENSINDPCSSAPILLATPSEPGWCTGATNITGGKGSISSILKDLTGEMGIPDTAEARSEIQKKLAEAGDESPDMFQTSSEVYGNELGNLSDRAATNLSVQTVLGKEGQKQMQKEIKQSSDIVQKILNTSDEAQGYDSTQNVVKALARINAQQSVLASMNYVASLKDRSDRQFTNLNLANISRSLDQQNRDRLTQTTIESAFMGKLASQSDLRAK